MYQEHSRQLSSTMPINYSSQKLGLFVTSPSIHASPSTRVPRLRFPRLRVPRPWVFTSLSLHVPESSRPWVFTSLSHHVPESHFHESSCPASPSLTSPSPSPITTNHVLCLFLLTRLLWMRSLNLVEHFHLAHVSEQWKAWAFSKGPRN